MPNNELKVFIGLNRTLNTIHRDAEKVLRKHDLTTGQFAVLEVLYSKGDLAIGEVQNLILTTSGNIPVIVRNLVKAGLIKKTQDLQDRRRYILSITDRGRALMDIVFPENAAVIIEKINRWSADEQKTLLVLLKKFGGLTS